jgi:hypothetical protein
MSYSPTPFSNRMPYGGPDAPQMPPGPSHEPVLDPRVPKSCKSCGRMVAWTRPRLKPPRMRRFEFTCCSFGCNLPERPPTVPYSTGPVGRVHTRTAARRARTHQTHHQFNSILRLSKCCFGIFDFGPSLLRQARAKGPPPLHAPICFSMKNTSFRILPDSFRSLPWLRENSSVEQY